MATRPDWIDVTFRVPGGDDHQIGRCHELLQTFAPGPSTMLRWGGFYGQSLRSDAGTAAVHYAGKGDAAGTICLHLAGAWWASREDPDADARAVYALDGHVARLDLAADYQGDGVPTVATIAEAVAAREWETRLRAAREVRDLMADTRTVYLGAAASDRRVRVYDRRGPVRVEVQTRNEYAARLLESVAVSGAVAAHRAAIAATVDFPTVPGWAACLAA